MESLKNSVLVKKEIEYSIDHYKDKFYIVTNLDALNFRLMETPETKTAKANWKEKIAHRKDTLLSGIEIFKDYMVLSERASANTLMRIIDQKTGQKHYLNFGEEAYTVYPSTNLDFDTDLLRYGYTSLTTPTSTFDYNMKTKERKLLKQQEVVGGYNPADYQTERLFGQQRMTEPKYRCQLCTKKESKRMERIQRCFTLTDRTVPARIQHFQAHA